MEVNLLDRMLSTYLEKQTPVTLVLQNKTRLSGTIRSFDSYIIVLGGQKGELVYRHSISALQPQVQAEVSRRPERKNTAPASATSAPPRNTPPKVRPAQKPVLPPTNESSINSSMKDGLLKWMQEQKEAKRA